MVMEDEGIASKYIFTDKDHPTTTKTRIIGQSQQIVRIDQEAEQKVYQQFNKKMCQKIKNNVWPCITISWKRLKIEMGK